MIPTPAQVVPLVEPLAGPIHESLQIGIDFADATVQGFDPFFHSHCVRHRARGALAAMEQDGWSISPDIANTGIHLRFGGGMHVARLLRSFNGNAPHPGHSRSRRKAWIGVQSRPEQLQFELDTETEVPPLSILVDWHVIDDLPVVHVSLPEGGWGYGRSPRLHWRVPLGDTGNGLHGLTFNPTGDGGAPVVLFDVEDIDDVRGAG
jgi:hypothetical protein